MLIEKVVDVNCGLIFQLEIRIFRREQKAADWLLLLEPIWDNIYVIGCARNRNTRQRGNGAGAAVCFAFPGISVRAVFPVYTTIDVIGASAAGLE